MFSRKTRKNFIANFPTDEAIINESYIFN